MRVSYDWLKTMIDIPEDPKTLSDEYIRTGTEVEAIDTVGESFDHVVTAKVLTRPSTPIAITCMCARSTWATRISTPTATPPRCRSSAARRTSRLATHRHGHDRRRASGDVGDQEEQASRRVSMGMNCSRASSAGRRPLRHHDSARGHALRHAVCRVWARATPCSTARSRPTVPTAVHDRHGSRDRRHLRPRFPR
ncbi:MAG: hypothetical protein ACLU0O_06825 [Collinsella sp.]